MDTTRLYISSVICAVLLFFVLRVILKRRKEANQLEEDLNKDELFTLKQETGDFFEEPEEQRFISDEEIQNYTGENEKEIARVNNHLIKNEIKNLDKIDFFDLQESILIYEFGEPGDNFKVDHIYQLAENRFVAVISMTDVITEEQDQEKPAVKQLIGIIQCPYNLGNGRFKPFEYKAEAPDADGLFSKTEIRIGNYVLIPEGYLNVTYIEALCNEIDKQKAGYIAYFTGETIYIRIDRPAVLTDLITLIEILKNYQF